MADKKMLFWRSGTKATHPTGWEVCFFVPSADRTLIYNLRGASTDTTVDFGWDDYDGDNNRDRSTTYGLILSGLHWMSSTAREIIIDLPNGAGTYNVGATCCDTSGSGRFCDFNFVDGSGGTVLHNWTGTSSSTTLVNIDGTTSSMSTFDYETAPTEEMTFTSSQAIMKLNGGTRSYFNAIWFSESDTGSVKRINTSGNFQQLDGGING